MPMGESLSADKWEDKREYPCNFYSVIPMNELAESVSLKKLPVFATIREAVEGSWQHRGVLLLWLMVCVIVSVLSQYGLEKFLASVDNKDLSNPSGSFWVSIFLAIPNVAVFSVFAVLCHRFFLLKGQKEEILGWGFTKRVWAFVVLVFCLYGGILFCLVLGGFAVEFLILLGSDFQETLQEEIKTQNLILALNGVMLYIICGYFFARYCLVFPATAVDQNSTLDWSWDHTTGNEWRLVSLVGMLPLVLGLFYCLPSYAGSAQLGLFNSFLEYLLFYLFTLLELAIISIAFRELTNWTPSAPLSEST